MRQALPRMLLHPASEYQLELALQVDGNNTDFSFHHDREDKGRASRRVLPAETSRRLPQCSLSIGRTDLLI